MLTKDKKEIAAIFVNGRPIAEIYKNSVLLWQSVRSCFGKGFWLNVKPWDNKDAWKN